MTGPLADTGGRPRLARLLRAAAVPSAGPQAADWHASPAEEPEPMRARGALSQEELAASEWFALRNGVNLPDPTDFSARQSALAMLWGNMQSLAKSGVAAPSISGDPASDARRAVLAVLGPPHEV